MPDNIINQKPSLSGAIKQAFKNMLKEVHTTIPGEIVSFDPETQTAEVQPTIRRIFVSKGADGTEEERFVDIPKLINVPVVFLRGGGWCITFPVKPGDECIVHFSERSIDQWRKESGVQNPKDWRMHSYSDAICQVGLSSEANAITSFNNDNFQVRNESGTVFIELRADSIVRVVAPGEIILDSPLVTFTGSTVTQINQKVNGVSTAIVDHISAGVSGKGHRHAGSPTAPVGPVTDTGVPI